MYLNKKKFRSGIANSTKTLMNYKQITLNTFLWQKGTSKVEDFLQIVYSKKMFANLNICLKSFK